MDTKKPTGFLSSGFDVQNAVDLSFVNDPIE